MTIPWYFHPNYYRTPCNEFQYPECFATPLPGAYGSHHSQHASGDTYRYPQVFSPRYNSSGYYATASNKGRNKGSWSSPPRHEHRQRNSFSHQASHRDFDENEEVYEYEEYFVNGIIYRVLLPRSAKQTHYHTTPSRQRRESFSTPQPHTAHPNKAVPKATEADARKHRIPPGYSLKNWDPSEEPIMVLGSVFDADSLGKWIYDWTVYHHGPTTPIADMAGELWLLLIQLAGTVKHAEDCVPRIRAAESREMVDDFIESGERLTEKLKKLLKSCETPMLAGKNTGTEFVDSIFGRDRQLKATEKFMASVRLWKLRFDANCVDILERLGQ